jgi:non-specific serine/threonine protein kinase/serine/threonine-protein kinase
MSTDWHRIRQLFDASRSLSPFDRQVFLDDACSGDSRMRDEVASLLEAHRRSGDFLENPVIHAARSAAGGLEGRLVGPYAVGPRIGTGGMGDVYRATDTRLNRAVAIKVQSERLGWRLDRREQFAREAQAISALNHPHICLLHDVGHDEAIDYLVMEYVEGEPIDVYCQRHALTIRQRLALFATVCDAVHYAHQNLVVHRDLKPRNILVTASGQPKLLDFGIAKLLSADGKSETLTTFSPGMTPDYASPEQVRGQAVTTATDVYSLGVVLYELLTGRRPFTVCGASLEEVVNKICAIAPIAPSAAADGSGASMPASRQARELSGDVDTIVLKALRKEPDRRYLSAQALSDDIRRYLGGQPVEARGDALRYRVSKFVARHRVAAAVAAVVAATLVAAMALVLRHSQIAETQRQRAERRFADVRRLAGSFLFEFHDAIKRLPGSTRARELVAQRGLEYLDSLAAESTDDPTLRAELARAYHRVGDVQGGFREANLGNVTGALASYRKALSLQQALVAASPTDRVLQRDLAATLVALGDVQLITRDLPGALDSFRRGLAIREALNVNGADRDLQRELAISHHRFGDVTRQLNDPKGAADSLQRAIAILEPLAADERDLDSRHALARSYKTYGILQARLRDYPANLAMVQKSLRLNESLAAADPLNMTVRNEVAMSSLEEGLAYQRLKNLPEALKSFRRAQALTASMSAADGSNIQGRWLQGLELNLIGDTLLHMRRHAEASAAHLQALALLEGVSNADPANENYHYNVANTHMLIGHVHVALAREATSRTGKIRAWTDARAHYSRSADVFDGMRQRGKLTANFVPDSEKVRTQLALCDRELAAATVIQAAR